ncbi:MAG: mRNA interferase [archaeon GW2011_AR9]|nr:MAG: mRNA interferase [archaeon GW2011_AR9]MBS3120421.1 type II toxin-antitoxin system PemK/MazF family toxin [Candidatus Woesearchaeota archaeon]HIG93821.1 type II toxin-antitoxin system PemK/MazF family toxin [Candidatus Woesearchaeota archaeon]HIH13422.1 type II toxin-antitoxin system PemK/MazF family toxin [Candidatus Woesearchaeota archaeon]
MSQLQRGDIWLVGLDPTVGHEIKKSRPAVIIQNDIGNKYSQTTIIAPVTSQNTTQIYPTEVLLTIENSQLGKESKVLLNQIRAIDKQRLIKKLGKVHEEIMPKIDEALKISLGLNF